MSASSNSTAFHEPADGAVETHNGAAFFDLDRTLLAGASGEVFADAMRLAGLSSKPFPGEKLLFGLFNTIGETLPSMALARQAVTLAKGHSQAAVSAAADQVADRLVAMVQPFAETAFAAHRAAGCAASRVTRCVVAAARALVRRRPPLQRRVREVIGIAL